MENDLRFGCLDYSMWTEWQEQPKEKGKGALIPDGGQPNDDRNLHSREERPQGLLYFTRYNSVPVMVDALFDAPTSREFSQSELAEKADLSQRTVSNRINILFDLGIIKEVPDTARFTLNLDGGITWKLRELDGLIKKAQADGSTATQNGNHERSSEEEDEIELVDPGDDTMDVMETVRQQALTPQANAD